MTYPAPGPTPPVDVGYQGNILVDRDNEHLRMLSICWYVFAGLTAFLGCFPIIHVGMGLMFVLAPPPTSSPPAPAAIGWIFVIVGSVIILFAETIAVLGFLAAYSLPKRQRLWVCYVAAALACLQLPFGTILGVFTFIVLSRPQVQVSFQGPPISA
jgi:hypothetical protein